ncbi:MAG: GGDEF domain-containing protein [Terracidiphilus sp.]
MTGIEGTRLLHAGKPATRLVGKFVLLLALIATATSSVFAATLTSLRAIRALTDAQADQSLPVDFQGTVTFLGTSEHLLFVQDGDAAITVQWVPNNSILPGDRVQIQGKTRLTFRPVVVADSVTLLHHGMLPEPIGATFDELVRADFDSRYVTVYGIIRDAVTVVNNNERTIRLQLHTDGGDIDAAVDVDAPKVLNGLLDAQVLISGTVSGRFDGKMDETGVVLYLNSMDGVKVMRRAATDPWTAPITPMDNILSGYHVTNLSRRVRVRGTVTYYLPGSTAVLQQGDKSVWLMTSSLAPVQVGHIADATGFPDLYNGLLVLSSAELQDTGKPAPIEPKPSTWDELSENKNLFDLVTIDGTVVTEMRGAARDEYVLESNGNLFSVIYRHPSTEGEGSGTPSPMKHLEAGAKVRVTGVCFTNTANPFDSRVPFEILLRSSDDIEVVAGAPWVTIANLFRLIGLLTFIVLAVSAWNWMLRRRVHTQTAAITAQSEADATQERRTAQLEQWRSRILEDINSTRPLGEIVDHITEMVSFLLGGAACWCEINGGPLLGHPPDKKENLRIISKEIHSRSGLVLGSLYAGFDSASSANEKEESEAMATGVRLATLAIETRKLYADLVHRSEFDLLTDMYNRFSLDRQLQELIEKAKTSGSTFGLIYVDLDDFKLVNDMYGHHIGDLYLQEVSLRMKRQLRTGDVLGRLGGDEFAALVSVARGRQDLEEIAQRMERCFDAPFTMDGHILRGGASVGIAMYPDNGTTSDGLLNAADSAMYVTKNNRRSHAGMTARKHG